jgi:hypothetical protein
MHGNELRKNGQPAGLDILERAVTTAAPGPGRGAAVALLARAAASAMTRSHHWPVTSPVP